MDLGYCYLYDAFCELHSRFRQATCWLELFYFPHCFESKKAFQGFLKGLVKIWHRPTLPHVTAVPSALAGLTSLFGMGRGGHRRYRHLKKVKAGSLKLKASY